MWHPTEERILIKDIFESGVLDQTIIYVSDEFIRIENASGNFTEKYVFQDGILVAQVNTNGQKEFVHNDHLGSVGVITDNSGTVLDEYFYSPFGEEIEGDVSRYGYEGQEKDEITGEHDFHFRMYKSEWGRFNQPDTLLPNVYDPQQLNRYAFERNNPFKHIEVDGHYFAQAQAVIAALRAAVIKLIARTDPDRAGAVARAAGEAVRKEIGKRTAFSGEEDTKVVVTIEAAELDSAKSSASDVISVSDEAGLSNIEQTAEKFTVVNNEPKTAHVESTGEIEDTEKVRDDDSLPGVNDLLENLSEDDKKETTGGGGGGGGGGFKIPPPGEDRERKTPFKPPPCKGEGCP